MIGSGVCTAEVVQFYRLRHDLAVVRLVGSYAPSVAGQSVRVTLSDGTVLRLHSALPQSPAGKFEFHVRIDESDPATERIVTTTQVGDKWRLDEPGGCLALTTNRAILIADDTGLAPLHALILETTKLNSPPHLHLFYGGRSPRDLYATNMLYLLERELDTLRVTPVVGTKTDPDDVDEWYERSHLAIGFPVAMMQTRSLAQTAFRAGVPLGGQVLVAGARAADIAAELIDLGMPPHLITAEV